MVKAPNIILLLIIFLLCGCVSLKKEMTQTGENMQAVAIHNAILDFSKSCKLYKNDSVFSVNFNDSDKGADYYFCKNNLSKYKRVVTNIGLGYYKPPKLKCN